MTPTGKLETDRERRLLTEIQARAWSFAVAGTRDPADALELAAVALLSEARGERPAVDQGHVRTSDREAASEAELFDLHKQLARAQAEAAHWRRRCEVTVADVRASGLTPDMVNEWFDRTGGWTRESDGDGVTRHVRVLTLESVTVNERSLLRAVQAGARSVDRPQFEVLDEMTGRGADR